MTETAPKRARNESGPHPAPNEWFLLEIITEGEQNRAYRAPNNLASVAAVKSAIRWTLRVDAGHTYPVFGVALAGTIGVLISKAWEDAAELRDVWGLVDGRWDPRLMHGIGRAPPDGFAPLDLSSLAAEHALWEPVTGIASDYVDRLTDCSDEPTDLYQVAVLDGWC